MKYNDFIKWLEKDDEFESIHREKKQALIDAYANKHDGRDISDDELKRLFQEEREAWGKWSDFKAGRSDS